MRKTVLTAIVIVNLFAAAAVAGPMPLAAPIAAPDWWGLDDGNTRSSVESFSDDALPGDYDYHVGFAGADFDTWESEGFGWVEDILPHQGYGLWAIDNTGGNEGVTGYILIDIANIENPDNKKEVFFEAQYWAEGEYSLMFSLYTDCTSCAVYSLGSGGGLLEGDNHYYFYGDREIIPQPAQEYLRIDVNVGAGSRFALDTLYFGTHCEAIPEPSTIIIMLTGASGLFVAVRRKFRK